MTDEEEVRLDMSKIYDEIVELDTSGQNLDVSGDTLHEKHRTK